MTSEALKLWRHSQFPFALSRRSVACKLGYLGLILFRDDHGSSGTGSPLFRARAHGSQTGALSKRPGLFSDWRPDGGRIAFDFFQRNGSEQIATMRRDGSDLKVITSGKVSA
jgi:hypothetical protein